MEADDDAVELQDPDDATNKSYMVSLREIVNRALITKEKTVNLIIDSACNERAELTC